MANYLRSQIARQAGVNIETLRYYERKGLITPTRTGNGYRRYQEGALDRLKFIGRAKEAGFTLEEIRQTLELLALDVDFSALSTAMAEGISQKIEEVERRIEGLTQILAFLHDIRGSIEDHRVCSSLEPLLKNLK
jgi:MerR family transcriptional regulator, copper efflux regulator